MPDYVSCDNCLVFHIVFRRDCAHSFVIAAAAGRTEPTWEVIPGAAATFLYYSKSLHNFICQHNEGT